MSVKIMGAAWDLDLPAAKLIVLLAMADHADHNGENVFPSVELLAWKTGYSESQTRRIMKSLVTYGILVPQLRPGKTTLYSLHLDKGKLKPPFVRRNKAMQNDTPGGSTAMTPQGLHSYDTPGGSTAMTPESSLEPSDNHIASGDALEKLPQSKPKKERAPNPVFDAVALGSFKLAKVNGDKVAGAMIGKIVSWLKEQEGVTPERVTAFYEWYAQRNQNASAPRDVAKFATWWMQFDAGNVEADPYAAMFANLTIIGDKS